MRLKVSLVYGKIVYTNPPIAQWWWKLTLIPKCLVIFFKILKLS